MFGIEPIIYWRDQMSPLRAAVVTSQRREELLAIPPDRKARDAAIDLRLRLVDRLEQVPGRTIRSASSIPISVISSMMPRAGPFGM